MPDVIADTLATCPVCGAYDVRRLVPDWQALVEQGSKVPIIHCGNPWHYADLTPHCAGCDGHDIDLRTEPIGA